MHTQPPQIRRARPQDAPAFLRLLTAAGLPTPGAEACLGTAVLAWEDSRLIGSAALEVYGSAALLRSVAVHPERQNAGVGRSLVHAALELARSRGVRRVYLLTETAAGYFPRFGFVPIPRAAVDPSVQTSIEFTTACPASAQAMTLALVPDHRPPTTDY